MPDVYPSDAAARIRQLEKDVAELKALLQARPGQTQASKGWLLTDMSIPIVEAGTVHIGSNGGNFFAATTAGTKRMFLQATYVAHTANMTAGASAPGTYSPSYCQAVREDVRAVRQTLADQMDAERASGQQASS
ncbi:hypothetical protein AB0F17_08240 [Nonomuraea sp. NPDC026600]|uniref:hypothetical protein n=1 Tax=Nonomuraea sp. NPDC026600 TaxID=3155363 RepID=UPI0033F4A983